MTAGLPFPQEATPYAWDDTRPTPPETLRLWTEVGNGIDKSQTVVWKSAVESLDAANKFLAVSEEARFFVEKYMGPIISILVEQQPTKIGPHERTCVQESLNLAVVIAARDLAIQLQRKGECQLLEVLSLVFNKKKAYYKGNKGNWNVNHLSGLPEVRLKMIERFRQEKGFVWLHRYMIQRISTPIFPTMDTVHQILSAIADALPNRTAGGATDHGAGANEMEDDAIDVAKAVMEYINSCDDAALKKLPSDQLNTAQHDLQRIFDRLVTTRRANTNEFYEFWRALILKLITSKSLPLKLFGWQQVDDLLEASAEHRPPPRGFDVTEAGCTFVNGHYKFIGACTPDGYSQRGIDISYERRIPDAEEDGGGKKLTLFRCTMRSQQKWWFLSEADEEQPGTDRDIDYYQHKSKEHEETQPPPAGWVTCRNAGKELPPQLRSVGLMVPEGEEYNTLEHQLATWAIENGIIELVLGDSVHREIVARSTSLIKFLASMCERDNPTDSNVGGKTPNMYCLQTSHLLLAWKTCTRKADAAVSAQVYQLLVSILPSCPSSLAIPLLKAVQDSLFQSKEKRDYLNEVAEFCSALAAINSVDAKSPPVINLSDDVRAEVLELLWAVLIHPDAASLKSYENLKRYVTDELRVEPKGSEHRESYLRSCVDTLLANSRKQADDTSVDETQALRMVKLTHFVLEACPRAQASTLVMDENGSLPVLLFNELTAYMKRRKSGVPAGGQILRKISSIGESEPKEYLALSERLRIIRYVYGLSEKIYMSSPQLHSLWQLCDEPNDRGELMIFIASASSSGFSPNTVNPEVVDQPLPPPQQPNQTPVQPEDALSAAFTDEVCSSAFLNLFCSQNITFESLGEGAYRSFQFMFNKLRLTSTSGHASIGAALDALWRICLRADNDVVASQAMKDLLDIYISNSGDNAWTGKNPIATDEMQTDTAEESFGKRVFDCLSNVKQGLDEKLPGSELAAERCLRILNAAIGLGGTVGSSITSSTLTRLAGLSPADGLRQAAKYLPHGMRGQACYRKIGIMAKRTSMQGQQGPQLQQQYPLREDAGATQPRSSSTLRFSLDVHPLETLESVKSKVANYCQCPLASVKPISVSGRIAGGGNCFQSRDSSQMSLNVVPEDSVVDELGIVQGCEMVFVIAERQTQQMTNAATAKTTRGARSRDLSEIFSNDNEQFADKLFQTLLGVLEALPSRASDAMSDASAPLVDTHKSVWDLLFAMPSNAAVSLQVLAAGVGGDSAGSTVSDEDAMEIDSRHAEQWSKFLDLKNFHRSVYILLAIDAFLQPATEVLSSLPLEQRSILEREMKENAVAFRRGFIQSGGFDAVVRFFSASEDELGMRQSVTRMGNAVALRILKCCLFGNNHVAHQQKGVAANVLDEAGNRLLQSLSDAEGLLKSLTSMVVGDVGISTSTISDVLKFLRLLFRSPTTAQSFVSLPNGTAEKFLITLLLWEGGQDTARPSSSIGASSKVRKSTHDLILMTPILADHSLPWLIRAIDTIQVTSDSTSEYFDVLQKLVADERSTARSRNTSSKELSALATAVCKKISSCPRPTNETAMIDFSTGVLCGCLTLLRALIENGGGSVLRAGTAILVKDLGVTRWSEMLGSSKKGILALIPSFRSNSHPEDMALIDLMGVIFDAFLSPGGSSSVVAICCDKESRQRGFDVVGAAARSCSGGDGYLTLVTRVSGLVSSASPFLRHRWGQVGGGNEGHTRSGGRNTSKYSGLRNQGCTCYMNSVLQQLFMMPELRRSICSAPLPASIRSSGGVVSAKGAELVGKKVALQWDNGVSYDAIVEGFDSETGMHTIRYCPMQVATVGGSGHQQVQPEDISRLPSLLSEEFFLSEGRPGKETGVFEIVSHLHEEPGAADGNALKANRGSDEIEESEDESSSRHLMEEVQRTFIHLDEGSRGRCFDPRALVEACACLKLEFDVWQQNDASEFATKLLDRLEISLKRWAPSHFRYLDHTFGLKQTKQKICKECGLKTNREEKLLNVDCQIRGKSDIHEALGTMTEVEIMEGNNQVFCDRCKKNTDTVLRTAISELPNMLILSLKRFDLDYNTFETVKLNSRCAFEQTLNMKRYTLEGLEAMEKAAKPDKDGDPAPMDTGNGRSDSAEESAMSQLPDDDYEYKLAGVLVHAGVAQGGHYYSFIKDRNPGSEEKWYRFDDEDVTPFDPASIEVECFGGKVKKETKWPNGQVHTVESEQYANALMLFYEKVKQTDPAPEEESNDKKDEKPTRKDLEMTSGYDVFEPDVQRSNATHRWQTFLFDAEFQTFLKGLLGLCRLSISESDGMTAVASKTTPPDSSKFSWLGHVVQMLLTFVFDILLYSADKSALGDWVRMLEETLAGDRVCAQTLLFSLAMKTEKVSSSWLRTFLSDCPDQVSRTAAVRIFSAAAQSSLSLEDEQRELNSWAQTWKNQVAKLGMSATPLPCSLEGEFQSHEKVGAVGVGGSSSMGVILSYLNVLLDASPRNWRFSPELCLFIRNLASMDPNRGGTILRQAMVDCLIPARLTCLVIRERAPPALRAAFPGGSVSIEVAETQMRAEQNPTSHMMPMNGNQVLNPADMNYRGGGSPMDHLPLFEALGCLLGLRGVIHAPLVIEAEEAGRGRQRILLSDQAAAALRDVFDESCAPSAVGMGQREIEAYLQRCGVDSATVPTQKIVDIMAKYPTTGGNGKATSSLSLEGFLAYYRDTAQTNEIRVRLDLHTFGFRPDLSRRSLDSRLFSIQGREQKRTSAESVAIDVSAHLKDKIPNVGDLADLGLFSFQLYGIAYSASEPLAEHILAGAAYRRESSSLIVNTLKAIYTAPSGWAGNETLNAALMVLRVLASIPDDRQRDRISLMMQCTERPAPHIDNGVGLMVAARTFYGTRTSGQHYTNEIHYAFDRYVGILKELLGLHSIFLWMNENRDQWIWMERELLDNQHQGASQGNQVRGDYSARRDGDVSAVPLDHHHHSDSDMPGINDSEEEEDDDSRFEEMETYQEGPTRILVDGAGHAAVNGMYARDGYFERACKYSRPGEYKGEACLFSLFQCNVSNNTKHWYISIVPVNGQPGTSADVDFYSAPVSGAYTELPPLGGWTKSNEGKDPSPTLVFKDNKNEPEPTGGRVEPGWNNPTGEEDENELNRSTF